MSGLPQRSRPSRKASFPAAAASIATNDASSFNFDARQCLKRAIFQGITRKYEHMLYTARRGKSSGGTQQVEAFRHLSVLYNCSIHLHQYNGNITEINPNQNRPVHGTPDAVSGRHLRKPSMDEERMVKATPAARPVVSSLEHTRRHRLQYISVTEDSSPHGLGDLVQLLTHQVLRVYVDQVEHTNHC